MSTSNSSYSPGELAPVSAEEPTRNSPEIDKFVDHFLALMCDRSRRQILQLLSVPNDQLWPCTRPGRAGKVRPGHSACILTQVLQCCRHLREGAPGQEEGELIAAQTVGGRIGRDFAREDTMVLLHDTFVACPFLCVSLH